MATASNDSLIDGRFRVVERAGRGGMATIYRAVEVDTDRPVAIKLLDVDYDRARFDREAEVLAELDHPRIVRYLAHGPVRDAQAYLAMEWLEGFDLGDRLRTTGLTLREALRVTRDLADGLSVAHARGIVHRDLKPSNVFLRGGRSDGATLLDFGVARRVREVDSHTRTGALVGTPHYMAPEQASGDRPVGPPADVFALGCLLYECLTGSPPFVAEHLVGVLAKILFADPDPLSVVRPEAPDAVVSLVRAMLSKEPEARPVDASALVRAIDALGDLVDLAPPVRAGAASPTPRSSRPHVSSSEQQLVCVLLARVREAMPERVRERVGIELLADGTHVSSVGPDHRRVATDQAVHAARVALEIRAHDPQARIAIATGRGVVQERLPIGHAIDRAVALLPSTAAIVLDEVTCDLLDRRFEITAGSHLVGEHRDPDALRVLLGKPTPCVGREQELATLEATLAQCIDEQAARAVLIVGAAGMGKTRLRHELIRRCRARCPEALVVSGLGDMSRTGATYGLLASVLADLERHHDLVEAIAEPDRRRIRELLSEMRGSPVDDPCEAVARVRSEPRRLGEEIAAAFVELLRGEARRAPLLLVLEDIHWADQASLKLVERTLRELQELPVFVVALSRPQIDEAVWARHAMRLPLRPLSRKACERLVSQVLGAAVPPDVLATVVEQAAGNALFLEEMIRAVAEGRRELPGTVLAMLQSRIAGLPSELRRVLRCASVFGERFRRAGVTALLGDGPDPEIDSWLGELVRLEILEPTGDALAFRHGLVAEAAYGLLPAEDRDSAHLAAAAYLEAEARPEAIEIAEHYYRGRDLARAVPYYMRAGLDAYAVGDLSIARLHYAAASDALRDLEDTPHQRRTRIDILLQQVQIGLMAEVPDLNLARTDLARELLAALPHDAGDRRRAALLDYLSARVHNFMGRLDESLELCERVVVVAAELGDERLASAARQAIGNVTMMKGQVTIAAPILQLAIDTAERSGSDHERLLYAGNLAMCMTLAGRLREGRALHERTVAQASATKYASGLAVALAMRAFSERAAGEPRVRLTIDAALEHTLRSNEQLLHYLLVAHRAWVDGLAGDRDGWRAHREESRELAEALGGTLWCDDLFVAADAEVALRFGDVDTAIEIASEAVPRLRRGGLGLGLGLCEQVWGLALGACGHRDADDHLEAARAGFEASGQRTAAARLSLAWSRLCRDRGDVRLADEMFANGAATFEAGGAPELVDGLR